MEANFADWLAICETKARYCRFVDAQDWENYADCFTEDLVFDLSALSGFVAEGRDTAVAKVRESIAGATTAHHVHNPEMTFDEDGNGADVIWAMQDRVIWPEGQAPYPGYRGHMGFGHYIERYVRCADGRWRIKRVAIRLLHMDRLPMKEGSASVGGSGVRDHSRA